MTLFEIYRKEGFNKIYKILSGEVSIFEKRMETLLFVKFIGKGKVVILKKNKTPITCVDKILNPVYSRAEEHFGSIRYLRKFKDYIFKIGVNDYYSRLHYIDNGKERLSDYEDLLEYANLLKVKPMEYVYRGKLDATQKNEIVEQFIETKSSLAGVFDGKYYPFHSGFTESIPADLNVIIINDFMNFFHGTDIAVHFQADEKQKRYCELMNSYIYHYLIFNSKKYEDIRFDSPNYTLDTLLIQNQKLLEIFENNPNYIIIYKIILGTFAKNIKSRGLYSETDISNIKSTINKINLKLRGLDFFNLMNKNIN